MSPPIFWTNRRQCHWPPRTLDYSHSRNFVIYLCISPRHPSNCFEFLVNSSKVETSLSLRGTYVHANEPSLYKTMGYYCIVSCTCMRHEYFQREWRGQLERRVQTQPGIRGWRLWQWFITSGLKRVPCIGLRWSSFYVAWRYHGSRSA